MCSRIAQLLCFQDLADWNSVAYRKMVLSNLTISAYCGWKLFLLAKPLLWDQNWKWQCDVHSCHNKLIHQQDLGFLEEIVARAGCKSCHPFCFQDRKEQKSVNVCMSPCIGAASFAYIDTKTIDQGKYFTHWGLKMAWKSSHTSEARRLDLLHRQLGSLLSLQFFACKRMYTSKSKGGAVKDEMGSTKLCCYVTTIKVGTFSIFEQRGNAIFQVNVFHLFFLEHSITRRQPFLHQLSKHVVFETYKCGNFSAKGQSH